MNIVFLDVDYILNSISNSVNLHNLAGIPLYGEKMPFDESCMYNLKHIIETTDASIVITSCWRKNENHMVILMDQLAKYSLDEKVMGKTEDLGNRVLEIKKYLEQLPENVNFIILDDYAYMEDLVEYLVSTNAYYGLTEIDAEIAIKKLKKEMQ